MPKNLRELIKERQDEVANTDLQTTRAAEILKELSALLGNCNDRIRECDMAYSKVLLEHLKVSQKASTAVIESETTKEYSNKREARDTKELVLEMIRSLKYFLKAKEDEKHVSKFQ